MSQEISRGQYRLHHKARSFELQVSTKIRRSDMADDVLNTSTSNGVDEKRQVKEIELDRVKGLRSAAECLSGNRKAVETKSDDMISLEDRTRRSTRSSSGLPHGYVPRTKRLPQVSKTNASKNDMSASYRKAPGTENEFWGERGSAVELLSRACSSFTDWEDVINFRRSCSTLARIGETELRNRFACRITKRFALYFWMTFQYYRSEEIPYTRYQLSPKWVISAPIGSNAKVGANLNNDEIMLAILEKIGPTLTSLRFDEVSITGGLSALRSLLFHYAPHMTELTLLLPDFVRNDQFRKELEKGGGELTYELDEALINIPKVASFDVNQRPRYCLKKFEYQAKPGQYFPLQWTEVFRCFPKLECLKVRGIPVLEMVELMESLISLEKTPLNDLSMFYVRLEPPGANANYLATLYKVVPVKLKNLDFHLLDSVPVEDVCCIISSQSTTVQSLTLTRQSGQKTSRLAAFSQLFQQLNFPVLTRFNATNDIFVNLNFLMAMPALVELCMCETDPTESLPTGVIYSDLFRQTSSIHAASESVKTLILSRCLHLPSVNSPAVSFDWKTSFSSLQILHVGSGTDASLRLIFSGLLTLKELKILGDDVRVTDEGIVGFNCENLASSDGRNKSQAVRRLRCFPYVGDLQNLRSCVIGNDSVIGLKVTKLSLEFGFVECEYLSNLELYGTKVRVGDLEDKLQNHPSIVTARVSKDRDSTYYGLLSN